MGCQGTGVSALEMTAGSKHVGNSRGGKFKLLAVVLVGKKIASIEQVLKNRRGEGLEKIYAYWTGKLGVDWCLFLIKVPK